MEKLKKVLVACTSILIVQTTACFQPDLDDKAIVNEQATLRIASGASTPEGVEDELVSYPPGRWRLASLDQLQSTVLSVSHILVAHSDSDHQSVTTVIPWTPHTPPARGRGEALKLAAEVARSAAKDPSRFGELARQYSDDATTAAQGGALGGIRAADLYFSGQLLDALAVLEPGAVSRVVETPAGFHVLYRGGEPPAGHVTGAHLVIGYIGAEGLHAHSGMPAPSRSHAEALALAQMIYREANAPGASFQDLIQAYSEHPDKQTGGDFGTWSLREPTHLPRAVNVLRRLSIGEVAPPLDGVYGFEVIQRTVDRAPAPYAVEVLRLRFNPRSVTDEQAVQRRIQDMGRRIRADARRFDEYRAKECCPGAEQWLRGRSSGFTPAVEALQLGQVLDAPVREVNAYALVRRVRLEVLPPSPSVSFELPAPDAPDLDTIALETPTIHTRMALDAAVGAISDRLSAGDLDILNGLAAGLAQLEDEPWQRVSTVHACVATAERLLGSEGFAIYRKRLNQRLERLVLGGQETAAPVR